MSSYEIYNVEFSSARIHMKKARSNTNSYFDESYHPPHPPPPPQLLAPPLIKWFKAKPTYLHFWHLQSIHLM